MRKFALVLTVLVILGLAASAQAVTEMVIPGTRVGSSDWGANESINQLFSWATPTLGQPDPGYYIDTGGYAWDSGSEFNLVGWMDFGVDRTFTALDFATQSNNDGFQYAKLWISNSLSTFTVTNGSTSPVGTPDLSVDCTANGINFTQYALSAPITARYVVAQFLSGRITDTGRFHPRAWELRMEALPLPPPTAYWKGGYDGNWNTTTPGFNWTTDAAGTTEVAGLPSATNDVYFTADGVTTPTTTTLGQSMSVGSLNFNNTATGAVTINAASGHTLTIGSNGVTVDSGSGAHTINANVALGASQSWTVNSAADKPLTVSGAIDGTGITLTKAGSGKLVLTGANTYTGATIVGAGVLNLGVAEIADTSGPLGKSAAANPGSIVLTGGTLQYSNLNQNDYSGRFSTAVASQAYNVDTNGRDVIWATALTSSGGTLTKSGGGTLTLKGVNTYTGATTVSGGTLLLGQGGSMGATAVSVTTGGTYGLSQTSSSLTPIPAGASLNLAGGTTLSLFDSNYNTMAFTGGGTLSGANLNFDLGTLGTQADKLTFGGEVTTTPGNLLSFNLLGSTLATGSHAYTLGSAFSGGFNPANFTISTVVPGYSLLLSSDSGNLYLDVTAISTGNNSKLWVGGTQPTGSLQTTETLQAFGRVMLGSTPSADVTLHSNGTDAATTNANVDKTGAATTTTVNGPISTRSPINVGLDTATTGVKSGTVTIANQAGDSAGLSQGSNNGVATINVSGTVLANRVITATAVDFGTVHANTDTIKPVLSRATNFGTTGDNDNNTAIQVANAVSGDFSVEDGTNPIFNSGSVTDARTLKATFNTVGVFTNATALTLTPGTESEVSGQSPVGVAVKYSASVYSGRMNWGGATSTNWSDGTNWTDSVSGGVQVAPGLDSGFQNVDTATFNGSGSVNLNVTPKMNVLTFGTGSYTISGGSITLAASSSREATISVATGGSSTITANINPGAGTTSYVKSGDGKLTHAGATGSFDNIYIDAGTLQLGTDAVAGTVASTSGIAVAIGAALIVNNNTLTPQTISAVITGGGTLTKSGSGKLTLSGANDYTGLTTVATGTLQLNSTAKNAILNSTNVVNVQLGKLVFDYSGVGETTPASIIDTKMKASYNLGKWNGEDVGDQFTSTTAEAGKLTLGWKDVGSQVTVMHTYVGDFNLDGIVNSDDLTIWKANAYVSGIKTFAQGDSNYDGVVNSDDLAFWKATAYLPQLTSLFMGNLTLGGPSLSMSFTPTPEPSTLVLLVTGLLGLLCYAWRRRR